MTQREKIIEAMKIGEQKWLSIKNPSQAPIDIYEMMADEILKIIPKEIDEEELFDFISTVLFPITKSEVLAGEKTTLLQATNEPAWNSILAHALAEKFGTKEKKKTDWEERIDGQK